MIYKKVITEAMDTVAKVIHEHLDPSFYLGGGTAIALHIGHRESVDLDYFINEPITTSQLKEKLLSLFQDVVFTYEEVDTLWCVIDGVKCSFISRISPLLHEVVQEEHFRLAHLSDLVIMKLGAVCGREEYKDYFDLACLAKETDIRNWLSWWGIVNPSSDPIAWMTALSHVGSVTPLPLKVFTPLNQKEVEEVLIHGMQELLR